MVQKKLFNEAVQGNQGIGLSENTEKLIKPINALVSNLFPIKIPKTKFSLAKLIEKIEMIKEKFSLEWNRLLSELEKEQNGGQGMKAKSPMIAYSIEEEAAVLDNFWSRDIE